MSGVRRVTPVSCCSPYLSGQMSKFCCLAYCQNIHFQLYKCLHLRIWLWVIKSWKTFKKGPIQAWKSFLVNKAFFTCMNCKWHIFSNRILHGVHMWSVLFILLIIWNISCPVIKKCVFTVLWWKLYEQYIYEQCKIYYPT